MRTVSARASKLVAVGVLVISLLLLQALSPDSAKAALPKTVPPVLQKTAKNVTADALPTVQIDGVVWSQVIIGNKVFVGGSFSSARPAGAAPGTQTVTRKNLLMYSLKSGVLRDFAPEVNGTVDTLAASPDGKTLYVVGQFTRVGTAQRLRFAAFSVATGNLLRLAPAFNARVRGIAVTKSTVYLGGWFTAVGKSPRSRLAAISATTGKLRAWSPKADDAVYALVATPDKKKVIVGGRFYKVNGIKGWGMASVDAKSGARKRWKINAVVRNYGKKAAIMSLAVDKTTIYGTGYAYGQGNFEGTFAASPKDGTIKWLQDCHGDTYSVAPIGGVVYAVGHAHFCSNIGGFPDTPSRDIGYRALAMTQKAVGTVAKNTQPGPHYGEFGGKPAPALFNWFPDLAQGKITGAAQAAWSVAGNSTYISLGGEFPAVNGVPQQGLVRFAVPSVAPNASGPVLTGSAIAPTVQLDPQGAVAVSWLTNHDRDDRKLQYQVLRDGAVVHTVKITAYFWKRRPVAFADRGASPGQTHSYQIRTSDPDGNRVLSPAVRVTTRPLAGAQQKAGGTATPEAAPSLAPVTPKPSPIIELAPR